MLEYVFASGYVADLVLAVMAIEALIIFILMRRGTIQLAYRTYFFGIIAGGFIIIALRLALTGGASTLIATVLGMSFLAHIAEVFSFVRRKTGNPNYTATSYKSRSDNKTMTKKGL